MAIETPVWLQGGTYSARLDRSLVAQMWDEGVMNLAAFRVSQRAAGGANMSVDVSAGSAIVQGDDEPNQGNYHVRSTALENRVVTAAPGSNSRYDLVVLRVNDPTAGGPAGNSATIEVIAGTPSATPAVPATPNTAIALARLGPIGVGKTSILDADILDLRPLAGRRDQPGTMMDWTGPIDRVPNGWGLADGQAVSRAANPGLNAMYAAMGYPYGVGDGVTTFNLPNREGRVFVGKADAGTFATIGATGGAETVTLTEAQIPGHVHTGPSHVHTGPSHTHVMDHDHPDAELRESQTNLRVIDNWSPGGAQDFTSTTRVTGVNNVFSYTNAIIPNYVGNTGASGTGNTGASGTANTGSTGGGTAHTNLQPYQVISGSIVRLG